MTIIILHLNLIFVSDTVNFLGISIVGQSNKGGDGGIYVGSIMKGWVSTNHVKFSNGATTWNQCTVIFIELVTRRFWF